jgi:hypothetical protein
VIDELGIELALSAETLTGNFYSLQPLREQEAMAQSSQLSAISFLLLAAT